MMHPRGFGFVRPEGGGPDIFVPMFAMGGALHGDKVRVQAAKSAKGEDGSVRAIEARWIKRLTGTLGGTRQQPVLEPDFARLRGPMPIDGAIPRGTEKSDVLVAEIIEYPRQHHEVPIVRILHCLGPRGRADVEVEKIKIQEGVEEQFPAPVRAEAELLPNKLRPADREGREDLRHLDLVSIDPPDARDHDDAVWIESLPDGGFHVFIAIADVSHYVLPGSEMDRTALERGCSIYLPDRAIPMLPEELSTHMASLVPGKDRLCMAVEVTLSARGAIRKQRVFPALMRSKAKLTYGGVARALGLSDKLRKEPGAEKRRATLEVLLAFSKVMRKKRAGQGRLDFDLPEARVTLDETSKEPIAVYRSKADTGIRDAYRMVEEMMLLGNEVVAEQLHKRSFPGLFRVHGKPQEEKIEAFLQLANALGESITLEDAGDPKQLSKAVRRLAKSPQASILHYLLLRSMPQAMYETENRGHFGLAAKHYLHFTSPIRRYPDLVVHRMVKRMLAKETPGEEETDALANVAIESSRLERRASTVERATIDVYRVLLMQNYLGEEFEGNISGVEHFGVYVTLDEPFVDVLVPVERLGREPFALEGNGLCLVGKRSNFGYGLGDRIRIRLDEANLSDRRLVGTPLWLPELTEEDEVPIREAVRAPRDQQGDRSRRKRRGRATDTRRAKGREQGREHGPALGSGQGNARSSGQDNAQRADQKRAQRKGQRNARGSQQGTERGRAQAAAGTKTGQARQDAASTSQDAASTSQDAASTSQDKRRGRSKSSRKRRR